MRLLLNLFLFIFLFLTTPILSQSSSDVFYNCNWRISLNGGVGFRIANSDLAKENLKYAGYENNKVDNYVRNLKRGLNISGKIHYLINTSYGFGVDYKFFKSTASISGYMDIGDGYSVVYVSKKDKVYTNYFGPSFYSHFWLKEDKLSIYSQTSLGFTIYRQESISNINSMLITGNAIGGNIELGVEMFLLKNLSLGVSSNFFWSSLSSLKIDDGNITDNISLEGDQKENLNRIDLSIGIQMYF